MSEYLVLDKNNSPIFNEFGHVLIYDSERNCCCHVIPSDKILNDIPQTYMCEDGEDSEMSNGTADAEGDSVNAFEVESIENGAKKQDSKQDSGETNESTKTKGKAYWTYELTIVLINKYKENYALFADSIHKNTEIWDKIAKEFRDEGYSFDGHQCENRWKYIKGKYIKKKDNDSISNTGGAYMQFEYFEEMDDIFGKKPNVTPKYLSSSSKPVPNSSTPVTNTQSVTPTSVRSVDRIKNHSGRGRGHVTSARALQTEFDDVQMFFSDGGRDSLDTDSNEISDAPNSSTKTNKESSASRQERYHNEMLELQRESLAVFKDVMNKIADAITKK